MSRRQVVLPEPEGPSRVKNGAVWAKGDALYYALNMDHFYRFYPQEISSVLGLNLFRLATWITHWWEALFPLMIVGMITRWGIRERLAPLHGWRLWAEAPAVVAPAAEAPARGDRSGAESSGSPRPRARR